MNRRTRSVRIGGDATGAIIIQGDHSPVLVFENAEQVLSLVPLEPPPPVPPGAGPALLLAARHEVVPFVGRADARADAAGWLAQEPRRAVRLLRGSGGQGKTRSALQVARDAAAAGWQVMVARRLVDGGPLPTGDVAPASHHAGVLVLVDYADRWAADTLLSFLMLVTRPEPSESGPVRVLLMARSTSFWATLWPKLRDNGVALSMQRLPDLPDDAGVRRAMFDAAVGAFDAHPALPPARIGTAPRVPDLAGEGFSLVLAVQMAAMAAVLRTRDGSDGGAGTGSDPSAVSRELLVREIEHWDRAQGVAAIPRHTMARAVLVGTLTGGVEARDATELLSRLGVGGDAQTVADQHRRCYPAATDRSLEPLYPDRLGEDFAAALLPGGPPGPDDQPPLDWLVDPDAPRIVDALLTVRADPTVTVLVETARRWPHVAELLRTRLDRDPAVLVGAGETPIVRAATIPGLATALPRIGDAVEDVIGAGTHLGLDNGAVAVREEIVERVRADGDPARLADELTLLASRLVAVGRTADALRASTEAVGICRELAAADRRAQLPLLSIAVTNLATHLSAEGCRAEAVEAAREAVALTYEFLEVAGSAYVPAIVTPLNNLAMTLADEGRDDEALDTEQVAVRVLRTLVDVNREAHLPDLCLHLTNLSSYLADAGRWEEALAAAEEAVDVARELAGDQPEAHVPRLVGALGALAVRLGEAGRRADALTVTEEAVRRARDLVAHNRDAHLPTMATLLNTLSVDLAEAGWPAEALAVSEEVRDLHADLVARNRVAHLPDFAMAMSNLAVRLGAVGRYDEARVAAGEAVELRRELVRLNRAGHLLELAMAVGNLAQLCAELGRADEAVGLSVETVGLFRELVSRNREAHVPELAMAVGNLANHHAALGRRDEALSAVEEATTLFREAADRNRDAYLPALAVSLNNLALRRAETGRDGALDVAQEAADRARDAVALDRNAHLPVLALTLDTLAARCAEAGRRTQALTTAQKAVTLHRELVAHHRAAHLPGLGESLVNLAYHRRAMAGVADADVVRTAEEAVAVSREVVASQGDGRRVMLAQALGNLCTDYAEAGRLDEACETGEDAVAVWRELADRYPEAHLAGLADATLNHALRLHTAERDGEARERTREAVPLYGELADRDPVAAARGLPVLGYLMQALGIRSAAGDVTGASTDELRVRRAAEEAADRCLELQQAGRVQEAADAAAESVRHRRELVGIDRAGYLPDLALALAKLTFRLTAAGRHEDAAAAAEDGVVVHRELASRDRATHLPGLAQALTSLAIRLSAVGRDRDAVDAAEEGVQLRREIAGAAPDGEARFELSQAATILTSTLVKVGRHRDARPHAEEAVARARAVLRHDGPVHRPSYFQALCLLATVQQQTGEIGPAVETLYETVEVGRDLMTASGGADRSALMMALTSLSLQLTALGRHREARASVEELNRLRQG